VTCPSRARSTRFATTPPKNRRERDTPPAAGRRDCAPQDDGHSGGDQRGDGDDQPGGGVGGEGERHPRVDVQLQIERPALDRIARQGALGPCLDTQVRRARTATRASSPARRTSVPGRAAPVVGAATCTHPSTTTLPKSRRRTRSCPPAWTRRGRVHRTSGRSRGDQVPCACRDGHCGDWPSSGHHTRGKCAQELQRHADGVTLRIHSLKWSSRLWAVWSLSGWMARQ
jgi:hypothetical protein